MIVGLLRIDGRDHEVHLQPGAVRAALVAGKHGGNAPMRVATVVELKPVPEGPAAEVVELRRED